jgi:glycerate kinase
MTRVLLAPDKFKGTLTAAEVGAHLETGLRSVRPDLEIEVVPVSDGGDGLLDVARRTGYRLVTVRAAGPTGEPGDAAYAVRGSRAVIELAEICGLARLPGGVPAPETATSRGLGEVIGAALEAGCRHLLVGLGGSASTDGGAGLLAGLGASLLDAAGRTVADGGAALARVAGLDLAGLPSALPEVEITVACDVDNPLTGPRGAAAVYGPQKGATPGQVATLDAALGHWADVVAASAGRDLRDAPGAGAAGGAGFGLYAGLGAALRPGTEVVQELTGLAEAVARADLVVTGEGSLDRQTLHGKAPAGVAASARAAGVPVVAVAGRVELDAATLQAAGIGTAYSLVDEAEHEQQALDSPGPLLERIGARIAAALPEPDVARRRR